LTRTKLPERREALTISIIHPGTENHIRPVTYDISMGFPNGIPQRNPKEVFISCNKVATALDIAARDIATLISIAMQHGAMVDELAAAMTRGDHGEPQGVAGAVLDAVIQEMAA
jgi:hypothetical protein